MMLEWSALESARRAVGEGAGDPLALKHDTAWRLVCRFHGESAADAAREHFRSVVQRKQLPDEIPELAVDLAGEPDLGLLDLMGARHLGFAKSNSEGRRLVAQGGVRLDGEPVLDPNLRLGPGSYLLQVGKRRFGRIALA